MNTVSLHRKLKGKIFIENKILPLAEQDIKLIYTPGVAKISRLIYQNPKEVYSLTSKGNTVAIITDGTRILGMGNVGPKAALPVMEGKSMLYRQFGKISAFPLCLNTTNKTKIIETIKAIEPVFGAINLEDIESPKVLEISEELEKILLIPVFHDDRHGTAVVVLAGLINSLKIVKKKIENVKIVIVGAGSAGYCISKLLVHAGCKNIVVVDSNGPIVKSRKNHLNKYKKEIASFTNPNEKGSLQEVLRNADAIIGVSGKKNLLNAKWIKTMNKNPIVFALTNPDPEINPLVAKKAGVKIIATGSYTFHNKINNAVIFPYLMRTILDLNIKKINLDLLYSTALAVAKTIPRKQLSANNFIPTIYNKKLQKNITRALLKYKN